MGATENIKKKIVASAEELFDTALAMALDGDKLMLKILLPHVLPSTTESGSARLRLPKQGVSLERIPELAASLLTQISDGSITPKSAKEIAEVMGVYLQSQEMVESERKIEQLEELTREVQSRRKGGELINLAWRKSQDALTGIFE